MTFDEEKYQQVSDIVNKMGIDYETFDLFGIPCVVVGAPSKNGDGTPNGLPAEYAPQESGEWAIYIWEDLEEKIQKPLLFHEFVEVYHKAVMKIEKTPAHNATMSWEKRFCEEYLTPLELKKYLDFKKGYGYNGFDLSDRL
jgi:hypothetical protein